MATTDSTKASWTGALRLFFLPASRLMDQLRYAPKFVLIGLILLAPLAILAWLQSTAATFQIDFNQKESYGVAYINPVREMMAGVERHRILQAAVLLGEKRYEEPLSKTRVQVDQKVLEVDQVEVLHGALLKTSRPWETIKKTWTELRGRAFVSADASDREHAQLSALLIDLILNYAGNYSNLILDPDLDSYWLMDAFVIKLPALMDTTAAASLVSLRTSAASISAGERIDLAGLYKVGGSLADDLVNVNMKTSFQENKSGAVKAALDGPARQGTAAVKQHLAAIRARSLETGGEALTLPRLVDQSLQAVEEVRALWDKVSPQLDTLALARVARYRAGRTQGAVAALVAIALLVYMFAGFYLSVEDSAAHLRGATERMIAGTTETFVPASRDELGDIAGFYNKINTALVEARGLRERGEKENRELQESILSLLRVVSEAADGNLTVRARVSAGALGNVADAFNQMIESWENLVGDIRRLFERTSAAVQEIQSSSEGMATGASHQVQEILEASEAVKRMTTSIQQVSGTAETAAAAAKRTQESARAGSGSVQDVVRGMDSLRAKVQAGAKKIKNLGDRSMEITGIVGTIAKISDQTNMLALNAAIEAARAGEHGRGFSVVADQVRQLAERTASATQEIEGLVRLIQSETNESVEAIEQQTEVVEQESKVVGAAGDSLVRIHEVSTHSAQLIEDISSAAKTQVEGAMDVARVMERVSAIARRTETGADESLKATRELASLSSQLAESVNRFQLGQARG